MVVGAGRRKVAGEPPVGPRKCRKGRVRIGGSIMVVVLAPGMLGLRWCWYRSWGRDLAFFGWEYSESGNDVAKHRISVVREVLL